MASNPSFAATAPSTRGTSSGAAELGTFDERINSDTSLPHTPEPGVVTTRDTPYCVPAGTPLRRLSSGVTTKSLGGNAWPKLVTPHCTVPFELLIEATQ